MKKVFLIIIAVVFVNLTLFAGDNSFFKGGDIDVPFFKSLFIDDEEYVKQELLKCKDVESVELKLGYHDEDDKNYDIFVYLKDNRFISFGEVQLYCFLSDNSVHDVKIKLIQINDLVFEQQSFKPHALGKTDFVYFDWTNFGEIRFFKQLLPDVKVGNMLEIIENIDNIYDFIKKLPEKTECSSPKRLEFEGFYETPFEIPEEFDNGIPISIIERKTDYASGKWYEKGYKFYKKPVERAIREATFKYAYKDYKTDY